MILGCALPVPPAPPPPGPPAGFAALGTWAWLPASPECRNLGCDSGADYALLVRSAIASEFESRGYREVDTALPDFYVSWHLDIAREIRIHRDTPAMNTLSSLHDSASFETTASERTVRVYEDAHLAVAIVDAYGRETIWRGTRSKRVRRSFATHAAESVSALFENFPRARPAPDWRTAGTADER